MSDRKEYFLNKIIQNDKFSKLETFSFQNFEDVVDKIINENKQFNIQRSDIEKFFRMNITMELDDNFYTVSKEKNVIKYNTVKPLVARVYLNVFFKDYDDGDDDSLETFSFYNEENAFEKFLDLININMENNYTFERNETTDWIKLLDKQKIKEDMFNGSSFHIHHIKVGDEYFTITPDKEVKRNYSFTFDDNIVE